MTRMCLYRRSPPLRLTRFPLPSVFHVTRADVYDSRTEVYKDCTDVCNGRADVCNSPAGIYTDRTGI